MTIFLRSVLAIATLLTTLICAVCCVWAFASGQIGLGIVAGLISIGFTIFVYHDCQYFFGKKD